jgi:hypothetical protein
VQRWCQDLRSRQASLSSALYGDGRGPAGAPAMSTSMSTTTTTSTSTALRSTPMSGSPIGQADIPQDFRAPPTGRSADLGDPLLCQPAPAAAQPSMLRAARRTEIAGPTRRRPVRQTVRIPARSLVIGSILAPPIVPAELRPDRRGGVRPCLDNAPLWRPDNGAGVHRRRLNRKAEPTRRLRQEADRMLARTSDMTALVQCTFAPPGCVAGPDLL